MITASAAGELVVTGRKVKPVAVSLGGPGPVTVTIKPTKAGKKALRRKGKLTTTLTVAWRPAVGVGSAPAPLKVTLKRKH